MVIFGMNNRILLWLTLFSSVLWAGHFGASVRTLFLNVKAINHTISKGILGVDICIL